MARGGRLVRGLTNQSRRQSLSIPVYTVKLLRGYVTQTFLLERQV